MLTDFCLAWEPQLMWLTILAHAANAAPASSLEALSTSLGAFLWTAIGLISTIGAVCSGYIRLHTEPWVIRASRRRWRLSAHCLAGARFTLVTFRRKKPFSDDRATNLGARTRRQVAADKL